MLQQVHAPAPQLTARQTTGRARWIVCGLLFYATTVNYVDRQILGILKPVLQNEMHWSEADFGWIVSAFQLAYAVMMPLAGRFIDRLGTRAGYALAVAVWSLASISHALASNLWQFIAARFALGLGEASNFPAAIKTVAEWFPKHERSFATGLFNSGSNLGAIIAPLMVPILASRFGWRASFLFTGVLDVSWIIAWLLYYRSPLQHETEQGDHVPWSSLLQHRAAWAFIVGKTMTDPAWWFYLFWVPGFLNRTYRLDLTHLGAPLIAIYVAADVGSIAAGWLPAKLVHHGWTVTKARRTTMLICAIAVTPVAFVMFAKSMWVAVALIGIAAAAHQGWSANLFTVVSDNFSESVVGSVVGLGGFAGAIAGMIAAVQIGYWLDFSSGFYGPLFVVAGTAYLVALGVIYRLTHSGS